MSNVITHLAPYYFTCHLFMSYLLRWIMSFLKQLLYSFTSLSYSNVQSKLTTMFMETTNSWHKPGLLPLCEGPKAPAGILKSSFSKSQDISSSQIQLPSVFQLSTWWTLKNGPKCKGVSRSLRVKGSVEVLREGLVNLLIWL